LKRPTATDLIFIHTTLDTELQLLAKQIHRSKLLIVTELELPGLRGWEFCTICQFFAHFSTFTKIPQVPSFQAHSPVKTV
jgi:hypothetical protein